jgi:protein-disulfide isomerase
MELVPTAATPLRSLVLALTVAFATSATGCHAQTPPQAGVKLSPDLARRIEVMIRSRSQVPPEYTIAISDPAKSDVPGFEQITVTFSAQGNTSRPLTFLLSTDGKTLAQFNKFDLSADPKAKVSAAGRPARGGPDSAPVLIVAFDDLECPFCAKMHSSMFPAILDRYKDEVRVVYLDFPLDQHPWAMRAAVDANCLAAASPAAYWSYIDYVHAHAAEFGGDQKSVAKANEQLDKLTLDQGAAQKANAADLEACVKKQDESAIKASVKEGEALGVEATPVLFINGEKIEGALPMETIYRVVDGALIAAGKTPPPAAPVQSATPATTVPAAVPSKPGN